MINTGWTVRAYDAGAHLEYIVYIYNHFSLPPANLGFETYHPPLFYIIGAGVYAIGKLIGIVQPEVILLGLLSICYTAGALIFGSMTIEKIFGNEKVKYLVAGLFIFWPSFIIQSTIINNDTLFFSTYIIGIYFLISYIKSDEKKKDFYLYVTLFFAFLTTVTKFNGISLFGAIILVVIITYYKNIKKLLNIGFVIGLIILLSGVIALGNSFYYIGIKEKNPNFIMGNADEFAKTWPMFRAENNNIEYFIFFKIDTFLNLPFMSPWEDSTSRKYFWNFLLKTSISEDFGFKNENIVKFMSFLLLVMIAYTGISLLTEKKKTINFTKITLLIIIGVIILSCIAGRIRYPFYTMANFRYVIPVIVPASILFGDAIIRAKNSQLIILEYLGYLVGISFVVSSIYFFLTMY